VDYTIVRPCGLNDKHPAGSRPLFTQGDVAVGRINRKDVAKVMVDCLCAPEATGKTFEVIGVAGYQPPTSIRGPLAGLRTDKEGLPPLDVILSTYTTLQQLLPGESQDSAALAMGQTYEQLDKGEEGRLGPRGKEKIDGVAPTPSS
jgi:NAD(P)H-binding